MRIVSSLVRPIIRSAVFCGLLLTLSVTTSAQTQHWTGDGGRGRSITVMVPQAARLPDSLNYLPVLVQGELVDNFSNFSAIEVFDRQAWEKQQEELMSGAYDDASAEALINIGRQAPTQYFLTGNITRTGSGYTLQLQIVETAGRNAVVATYSGTFDFRELDNLTGVRRASAELLQKMGVTLTAQARTALAGAATSTHVNAQTALSRGIVAQRQGTEVAALSYFYQAAAFDPSLAEAVGRSQIMSANISSANIGENIRNDIVWRRDWVARLRQTEETFYQMLSSAAPPYTLFYSTGIETRDINYQTETANLSIPVNLTANAEWFAAMNRALRAANEVLNGLNATNRKDDWQLRHWPSSGVSNTNPFNRHWQHDLTIAFELVDEQGRVIGRQTARLNPSFNINVNHNNQFTINYTENTSATVTFNAVRADDISDKLSIRVASINGRPPEAARLAINAISDRERQRNIFLRIENGVVMGFANNVQREQHRNLVIPAEAFGNPVTAIANGAFEHNELTSVTIPNSVTTIGARAFANNQLKGVIIPDGVRTIGEQAFANNNISASGFAENSRSIRIRLPNGFERTVGIMAFAGNPGVMYQIEDGIVMGFAGSYRFHVNQERTIVIPSEAWGRPVTAIAPGAFENQNLTGVTLPNSVTSIGERAFANNQLTSVIIPNSVRSIENMAFVGNDIVQVTIGDGVDVHPFAICLSLITVMGTTREICLGDRYNITYKQTAGTYVFERGRDYGRDEWHIVAAENTAAIRAEVGNRERKEDRRSFVWEIVMLLGVAAVIYLGAMAGGGE